MAKPDCVHEPPPRLCDDCLREALARFERFTLNVQWCVHTRTLGLARCTDRIVAWDLSGPLSDDERKAMLAHVLAGAVAQGGAPNVPRMQ